VTRPMSALWGSGALGALACLFLICSCGCADLQTVTPSLNPGQEGDWLFARGEWEMGEGVLEQTVPDRGAAAVMESPAFSDFTMTCDFNVSPVGSGVRAAAVLFRATGTMSYYWLHLDTKNNSAIFVRSTPDNTWMEIKRVHVDMPDDTWHTVTVTCAGPEIKIALNDKEILAVTDDALSQGCVGLGTSQAKVTFRNLKIEGNVVDMPEPLANEEPPYKVISRGEAAGSYQAFPDACRLQNGDIMAVFYGGYGHVSLPNDDWPKGGRICMVRSSDEGRTWTEPEILFDDDIDNRDPHIAQMSDGTLICSFFSLKPKDKRWELIGTQIVTSTDGGKTWEKEARTLVPGWAVSAPVREMPDGTYILGIYKGSECGGVIRSTDKGKTWSEPIPIGLEAKKPLDAETDVILCKDGRLYAALRSSRINMHYAWSDDMGLTWSPVEDIGFVGHAPHLYRISTGEILLTHRVPSTSMHISRDECKTWEGPYIIDSVGGAYPATVELKDGTIMVVYYEEGGGSAVRTKRFKVTDEGLDILEWD